MTLPCDTVELPFNGPLYNEVLGITNDTLQPGQSYRKNFMGKNLDRAKSSLLRTKSRIPNV